MANCEPPPYGCGRVHSTVNSATGLCAPCTTELNQARNIASAHVSCTMTYCRLEDDDYEYDGFAEITPGPCPVSSPDGDHGVGPARPARVKEVLWSVQDYWESTHRGHEPQSSAMA